MRRINSQLETSELPELNLSGLSEDHRTYLRHMLGLIETGDMFHGRFVEVHVGNLLGADIADSGINGWDLRLDGESPITIEVKAAALGRSYNIGSKAADVWVFVTFADKRDGPSGFRYSVAPSPLVAPLSFRRMKQQVIFTMFGEVTAPELSSAVKSAARQSHARGGQG